MPPRSFASLLALLTVLLTGAAAGPVAATGPPGAPAGQSPATVGAPASTSSLPDNGTLPAGNTTMRVELQPSGDARWSVILAFPLENDTESFDELATRFENGETATLRLESFEIAVAEAAAATDRPMELRDPTRSHEIENGTGKLILSFTWTEFARTSGDRLVVGDAFATRGATWLPELGERQTLEIVPPDGYDVHSSPVPIDGGVARWEGPYVFPEGEPSVIYTGDAPQTTVPTTDPPTTSESPTTNGTPGGGTSSLPVVPLLVVAGAGAAAFAVYRFRDDLGDAAAVLPGVGDDGDDDGAAGAAAAESAATNGDEAAAESADPAPGAAANGDGAAGTDQVDPELLSDEERVERLLEQNGGRMKQANIVKETGWSNAKVSQLLSSMAEEGRIDKLRIGRENLISFPDEDVTDVESE